MSDDAAHPSPHRGEDGRGATLGTDSPCPLPGDKCGASASSSSTGGITRIWALTDARPGTAAQTLGVAEKLAALWPQAALEEKPLSYTPLASLPNQLFGTRLNGLTAANKRNLKAPWPDIAIVAGRRMAPVGLWLKKQHPRLYLVQLMLPELPRKAFDLIVLPEHDDSKPFPNLLTTLGAPHRLSDAKLAQAKHTFAARLAAFPPPYTAVLIGGSTKSGPLTIRDLDALLDGVLPMRQSGSLLLTTSRRTPPALLSALRARLAGPHWLHVPQEGEENPYLAFLAAADRVVVTADSISMLSEACFRGVPVYAYAPQALSAKHHLAVRQFEARGLIRPLAAFDAAWHGGEKLDEATRIASEIARRVGLH